MNQKVLLAVVAAAVVVVVAAGLLLANNARNQNQPSSTQTTVETQSPTPIEETETPASEEAVNEVVVTLTESGFSPKTVTINAGDKVVFRNDSGKNATVNSGPHPIHTSYSSLNLGGFSDGETLELTFTKTGTYNYHNHLNASQTGSVVVE